MKKEDIKAVHKGLRERLPWAKKELETMEERHLKELEKVQNENISSM